MSVNLDEIAGVEYQEFEMSGKMFKLTLPSSADLLEMAVIAKKLEMAQATVDKLEKDDAKLEPAVQEVERIQGEILDWYAKYVSCETEPDIDFKNLLMSKPPSYLRAFTQMVNQEVNGSGQAPAA